MTCDPEPEETCDHDWKCIDDSFDHEFGTEVAYHMECRHCGAERPVEDADYEDDREPDDFYD